MTGDRHRSPRPPAIRLPAGGPPSFTGYIRDITEQKRADEVRRMGEFRWRRLVEQSPLSTQVFAADGSVRQVNRAWERLWGVTLADLPGYNILEDPQLIERGIMPPIRRAFAGEAVSVEPITSDNVTAVYGRSAESRIADPDDRRVFSWLMCESYDDKGNARKELAFATAANPNDPEALLFRASAYRYLDAIDLARDGERGVGILDDDNGRSHVADVASVRQLAGIAIDRARHGCLLGKADGDHPAFQPDKAAGFQKRGHVGQRSRDFFLHRLPVQRSR